MTIAAVDRGKRAAGDVAAFARYARGLRRYLEDPLDYEECRRVVVTRNGHREENFLAMLEGIFDLPRSPYRKLLAAAGVELDDARRLVREEGVEGALERLHDAGVFVSLDEFKGRRPIARSGLTLEVRPEDFDNPRLRAVSGRWSSGSRGAPRRTRIDFANLRETAVYTGIGLRTEGLVDRPYGLWRPVPPAATGLFGAVALAKVGKSTARWFTQVPLRLTPGTAGEWLVTRFTLGASRRAGMPIPEPEFVPLDRAETVARWLAEQTARGTPAHLNAPGSSGVRVCLAAREAGLDIAGTLFRFGGEPLTEEKARIVSDAGAEVYCNYAMIESGRIGLSCAHRVELDEVHLATDKLGVIQRSRDVGSTRVEALLYTSLLPTAAKVLLNVESDDYGVITERECGCAVGELGLTRHLHGIRSYEKLTSEGMSFVGTDLLDLVERVLPQRFGGGPSDYQLLEEEVGGLPKVCIIASPRLGDLDPPAVVAAVLDALGSGPAYRGLMASFWRSGDTLALVRREPYQTQSGKVLPLHVLRR